MTANQILISRRMVGRVGVSAVSSLLRGRSVQFQLTCARKPWFTIGQALATNAIRTADTTRGIPYTSSMMEARLDRATAVLPAYRILDNDGKVIDSAEDPMLGDSTLSRIYQQMVTLTLMDKHLYKAQRMAFLSFYLTNTGEEAVQFGSSAALDPEDMVYLQYREVGVLMWRGFSVDQCMDQCFSNRLDLGRGKNMPIHYGSAECNVQFTSSCLATQMPQASGYAYGLRLAGAKTCVCVYFGEGTAQEGDSHAAMNFAATLECPVVFFCRNNGYAISTPADENYVGDGIASRGPGYGIETIRVDGNDVLAVYKVTKYARDTAVQEQRPVLVETINYRVSSHSTSDDQTGYQDMEEVEKWKQYNNPITRLRGYMKHRRLWNQELEEELKSKAEIEVERALQRAYSERKPHVDEMFEDVYDKLPRRLQDQRKQMWEVVNKYKEHYPLEKHES